MNLNIIAFQKCRMIYKTGVTCGAGTAYPPEYMRSPPVIVGPYYSIFSFLCSAL